MVGEVVKFNLNLNIEIFKWTYVSLYGIVIWIRSRHLWSNNTMTKFGLLNSRVFINEPFYAGLVCLESIPLRLQSPYEVLIAKCLHRKAFSILWLWPLQQPTDTAEGQT